MSEQRTMVSPELMADLLDHLIAAGLLMPPDPLPRVEDLRENMDEQDARALEVWIRRQAEVGHE